MQDSLFVNLIMLPFSILKKTALYFVAHPKFLALVIIAIIGVIALRQFTSNDTNREYTLPEYQHILPRIDQAPAILQTTSRYYPVVSYYDKGEYRILLDYYVYNQDTWEHHTDPLEIHKSRIVGSVNR